MTSNSAIVVRNSAALTGLTPTVSAQVRASLSDSIGGWDSTRAAAELKRDGLLDMVPDLADQMSRCLNPADPVKLRQRLTMLGAAMAPNRGASDGAAWLEQMVRGLREFPEWAVNQAIDEHIKQSAFLPQVADLHPRAEALLMQATREAARLDAICRLAASGQPIPDLPAHHRPWEREPEPFREEDRCTPEAAAQILSELGLTGWSAETAKRHLGPPRNPTRSDYIAMGVDPATLDGIATDKREAA